MSYLIKTGCSTDSLGYNNSRNIVRDSTGRLHVVYCRTAGSGTPYNIYHSYSDDEGKTWTEEAITSETEYYHEQWEPAIAIDNSNNLHVVWSGMIYYWYPQFELWLGTYEICYSKFNGSSWSTPIHITDVGAPNAVNLHQSYPAIAVDSNNNLHVVWYGYSGTPPNGWPRHYQIRYAKYTGSWSTPIDLTIDTSNYHSNTTTPTIAIDSNDNLHVVYEGNSATSPNYLQIQYSKYDGSWSASVDLTSGNYHQASPSIAVDSNDNLHVVWNGNFVDSPTYYQIRYFKYTNAWSAPINLTNGSSQQLPNIAIDTDDTLYVVWTGEPPYPATNQQVGFTKYITSWGDVVYLTTGGSKSFPSILWAENFYSIETDDFHFVYMDGTNLKFYAPPILINSQMSFNQFQKNVIRINPA
jgi:hypothetical protein